MSPTYRTANYRRSAPAFITAFMITFFLGLLLVAFVEYRRIGVERSRAGTTAEVQSARISHVIDTEMSLVNLLCALLENGNGYIDNFDSLMSKLIDSPAIRNVALAPDGIITQLYPLTGNEAAMGHDLLHDPQRSLESTIALESHRLTLSGPYELRQGGHGLIGRLPVYLKRDSGKEYFWGFVCVTINVSETLSHTYLERLEEQGYAYELFRISPITEKKQVISTSASSMPKNPEYRPISLPNSTWTLSIAPVKGWFHTSRIIAESLLILLFALLCALLTKNISELSFGRKELLASLTQQSANYQLLYELNKDLRTFRHDVKNHMLSLLVLIKKRELKEAEIYLQSMSEIVSKSTLILNTENYVFDALLSCKLWEAENKGITVEREILVDRTLKIENQDFSILFGNALDNAIEACERSELGFPYLRISVRCFGSTLHVLVANTSDYPPSIQKNGFFSTSKQDFVNHGIGLQQITSVVKKYHGVIDTTWEKEIFTLSILLMNV